MPFSADRYLLSLHSYSISFSKNRVRLRFENLDFEDVADKKLMGMGMTVGKSDKYSPDKKTGKKTLESRHSRKGGSITHHSH